MNYSVFTKRAQCEHLPAGGMFPPSWRSGQWLLQLDLAGSFGIQILYSSMFHEFFYPWLDSTFTWGISWFKLLFEKQSCQFKWFCAIIGQDTKGLFFNCPNHFASWQLFHDVIHWKNNLVLKKIGKNIEKWGNTKQNGGACLFWITWYMSALQPKRLSQFWLKCT